MTRLLLVRHGQSTWNADGRWQGRADPPLSELGERQAADVVVVAARGGRRAGCRSTGSGRRPLAAGAPDRGDHRRPDWGSTSTVDARLQEVDAGEWTGLTRAEIEADWPGYLAEYRRPPGFETYEHLVGRALEALARDRRDGRRRDGAGGDPRRGDRGGRAPPRRRPGSARRTSAAGRSSRDDGRLELGERFLLLDPDDVEVTTPRQI